MVNNSLYDYIRNNPPSKITRVLWESLANRLYFENIKIDQEFIDELCTEGFKYDIKIPSEILQKKYEFIFGIKRSELENIDKLIDKIKIIQ